MWGYVDSINRIRRSTVKVVKVVSTWGNRKAKSGSMGRVFRFFNPPQASVLVWRYLRYQPTLGRRPTLGREFFVREASKARKKLTESFFGKASKKTCWEFFCDIQKIPGIQKMGMTMPHQWICTYLVFWGWWMAERDNFKRGYWSPGWNPNPDANLFFANFCIQID
jgi:hypothetical protein